MRQYSNGLAANTQRTSAGHSVRCPRQDVHSPCPQQADSLHQVVRKTHKHIHGQNLPEGDRIRAHDVFCKRLVLITVIPMKFFYLMEIKLQNNGN